LKHQRTCIQRLDNHNPENLARFSIMRNNLLLSKKMLLIELSII